MGSLSDNLVCAHVVVGQNNIWDGETFAILSTLAVAPDLAVIPVGTRKAYLYIDASSQIIIVDLPE